MNSWKMLSVFALAVLLVYTMAPVCGQPPQYPFRVKVASAVPVEKVPGQNAAWDHPITFSVLQGAPEVCYLEFTLQSYYSVPEIAGGPCFTYEYPFDLRDFAHTLDDNDCIYGTWWGFDEATQTCRARLTLECENPLSMVEVLPPARMFVGDDAPEYQHAIPLYPTNATVYWEDCDEVAQTPRGQGVMGTAIVSFVQ